MPVLALFAFSFLAPAPAPAPAPPAPVAAFEHFFTGATEGSGAVRMVMSRPHGLRDRARGRMERGALIIEQVIEEAGKPARRRTWRLVRAGGQKVTGSISDASSPVAGEVGGATLHLSYRMPEGSVEQWITLAPGGRTAANRMVFRRFGLKVATVESTIRKLDR